MAKKKNYTEEKEDQFVDMLLENIDFEGKTLDDLFGKDSVFAKLRKRFIEQALNAEMDHHLGYTKNDPIGNNTGNSRNGYGKKTIITGNNEFDIDTPRDRNSTFEPALIPKGKTHFKDFDRQIIAMYARGMSVRDTQAHFKDMYQVDVSEGLISQVTDAVKDDMLEWQNRPLESVYPIVYFDCIVVKCRVDGKVTNASIYLALGVTTEGKKELLGMWISKNEGAKFWLGVLTELKNRGVNDILIACVDGLKGFPEAINAVFPETMVQLCIVHLIRNSVRFVSWKERKQVCDDLKPIYTAVNEEQAEIALNEFEEKWGEQFPTIPKIWRDNWANIIGFLEFPEYIRKAIYTTNAIESLNRSLRKVIKTKGVFPSETSVMKIFYLALGNIAEKWTMPIQNWSLALNQFAIHFGDRLQIK